MPDSKEIETAILIADLAGYTALTEAHGNRSAAEIVTRYLQIVRESLQSDATLVERVGDEVLIMAPEAVSVILTAIRIREAIEQEPYFPTLHAGIHAGNLLEKDGHFYGSALNLTARVAVHARGGQIICTERVMNVASHFDKILFSPLGLVLFKNVKNPVAIFEVAARTQKDEGNLIDPVCRMQVSQETAPAILSYNENTYYFCSFECAKAFAENPAFYCNA